MTSIPLCTLINQHMSALARKFPQTKFLKSISTTCIANYPDKNLPTIFVYSQGNMKAQFIGPLVFGGMKLTLEGQRVEKTFVFFLPLTIIQVQFFSSFEVVRYLCKKEKQIKCESTGLHDSYMEYLFEMLCVCFQSWSGGCPSPVPSRRIWRRTPTSRSTIR